ncbi:MAG: hypothetical protein R3D00_11405 [Bacteroidia bacterium]
MNHWRKNIISVFLLLCLFAPFLGIYTLLHLQKFFLRKEIKHHLLTLSEHQDLVEISLSHAQASLLHWPEPDEFEFEGQMYDVVSQEMHKDTVVYWCWPDKEESRLNQRLSYLVNHASGHNPIRQKNQQRLIHFFHTLFRSERFTWHLQNRERAKNPEVFSPLIYCSVCLSPPIPPPETV